MRNIIDNIDKTFENRIRLGIMSVLMVNEWVDYTHLKELLDSTDGNLASHLKGLETKGYLEVNKEFVARKPKTSYKATPEGKEAFEIHLKALEALLKKTDFR